MSKRLSSSLLVDMIVICAFDLLTDSLQEGGSTDTAKACLDTSMVVFLHLLDSLDEDLVANESRVLAHTHTAAGHARVEGPAEHLRVELLDQRSA